MMELATFLGDFAWGLFGLFGRSAARGSRHYQLAGIFLLVTWVASWSLCFVGPETWRLAFFTVGLLSLVGAMICGYMRLDFRRPAKQSATRS
jgi:hypothetical protein